MTDGEESPFSNSHRSNGCSSGLDYSNASAANVSSASISKIWSLAQNLTRSVFTRSASQPTRGPVSTSHPRKEKPIRSFEGYVSNDEEDFDGLDNSRAVNHRNTNERIPEAPVDSVGLMTKRPLISAPDESVAFPTAKRSRLDETPAIFKPQNSSSDFRSRRRFWTSDASAPRPLYRPPSVNSSKPMPVSIFDDKNPSRQETPTNLFSIAPRPSSRALSTTSSISGAASFATLSSISEMNKRSAARNSETKRILMDLERVGGLPTPDSKRPRLWFQTISEDKPPVPRLSEKKRTPFGPPTASLRTTDRAQVLPTMITPLGGASSYRSVRHDPTPPIPAAVKRQATGEAIGPIRETTPSVFGITTLPSACKFTFSKPIPVSFSATVGNSAASFPNISYSKMVPFSAAETTTSDAGPLQFPKIVSTPSPAATSTTDSLSRPQSVAEISGSDKITFEDYKKAMKWKCASCHFNNNPDDNSCRQCFCARDSADRGNLVVENKKTWRCSKCRLDNPDSLDRCKCYQTSKNLTSAETPASDAKSDWSCSACFVSNKGSAAECVCCKTARPSNDAVKMSAKSKWSCSNCFVSNDDTATECACCNVAKPKTGSKSAVSESWWCGTCSIKNDAAVAKCVACGTERTPSASQRSGPSDSGRANAVAPSSKAKWSCPTCFASNESSVNECACCKTPKPSQSEKSTAPASGIVETTRNETAKPESGEKKLISWSCTTCFLSNTADRVKCIACQSPKPGAAFKPVRLGATLFGSPATTAVSTNGVSAGFPAKFGMSSAVPSRVAEAEVTAPLSFAKPTNQLVTTTASPFVGFGISSKSSEVQQEPLKFSEAAPLSFANPTSQPVATTGSTASPFITFGINNKPTEAQEKPLKFGDVASVSFAMPTSQPMTTAASTASPLAAFAVNNKTSEGKLQPLKFGDGASFSFVKPASQPVTTTASTAFTVSSKSSEGQQQPIRFGDVTSFSFVKPASQPVTTATSAAPPLIVFGNSNLSSKGQEQPFKFGEAAPALFTKPTSQLQTTAASTASPLTMFGSSNKPSEGQQQPLKFGEFAPSSFAKPTSQLVTTNSAPALAAFGISNSNKSSEGQQPLKFGEAPLPFSIPASQPATTAAPTFAFGTSNKALEEQEQPLKFGAVKQLSSLPVSCSPNPFSISGSSPTPVSGRRQLVAKRKAKRT